MNDGKVKTKRNFGCLVERRKRKGKESERKKMKWYNQFFSSPNWRENK